MKTNTVLSQVAQYTLKDAVLDAVNTLKSSGGFSAHDVTKAVREAANEGEYVLPGLEAAAGSSFKYNVKHESVKEVLDTLQTDGTLVNMGLTGVTYAADGYRVFEFADEAEVDVADADVADTSEDVVDSDGPVARRIKAYVDKNSPVTIRQIQSTLKVAGLTSDELVTMAEDLGYEVVPGTVGCFSTYLVE